MERRDFLRKSIQTTLAVGGAAALSSHDALVAHASGPDSQGSEQGSFHVLQASVNDGDWVDGAVQWWWKYVFPIRHKFWAVLVDERATRVADPTPDPWKELVLGDLLEATAMLSAVPGADATVAARLKTEAKAKLARATRAIG
jgi:hypothetical protein